MASMNYPPPPHFILHNILLAEEQHIANQGKAKKKEITHILEKYVKKKCSQ